MRYLPAAAAVTSLLVLTARARAESPVYDAGCLGAAPMTAASMPANIPGFAFLGDYISRLTNVSVLAPDGTTIPTTISLDTSDFGKQAAIVSLSTALQPDKTYTIVWTDECATGKTKTFTTTAAVTLPTTAGTVTFTEQSAPTAEATCVGGRPTWPAERLVIFSESPELIPFLPIAKVGLVVDGTESNLRTYGQYTSSDLFVGKVSQFCPAPTKNPRVAVRVKLAGGATLNTPEVATELRCLETLPGGCPTDPVIDGGVDSSISDATATEAATESDAREADSGTNSDPPAEAASESGCSFNSDRTANGLAGLALALLAGLVVRRRVRSE